MSVFQDTDGVIPAAHKLVYSMIRLSTLILTITLAGSTGCSSTTPGASEHATLPNVVVFVPGFKGSALVDEQSRRLVWLSAYEALIGRSSLTIPNHTAGLANDLNLVPDGVLSEISLAFGLLGVDVYGDDLKFLRELLPNNTELVSFSYDWRQDISRSAAELQQFIRKLKGQGAEEVSLISHSMGGLVSAYYLRYGSQQISSAVENWAGGREVKRAVFAGTPFLGAATMMRDLQMGITHGLNSSLLSRDALGSFPSSYQLLPAWDDSLLSGPNYTPKGHQLYDVGLWKLCTWGLFADNNRVTQGVENLLADYLNSAKKFKELLVAPVNRGRPSSLLILNIVGVGRNTLTRGVLPAKNCNRSIFKSRGLKDDALSTLFSNGDGTVPLRSQVLPTSYNSLPGTFEHQVQAEHSALLEDEDTRRILFDFFN